jgi:cell division protein FtsQ
MKKAFFIISDIIIGVYLVLAITSWNKPAPAVKDCQKVTIRIADENNHGFLTKVEIQRLLKQRGLYPLGQPITATNPRKIETELKRMPFVSDAQCSVTQQGHVYITVMQRTPLIRIKNILNQDFYIDDNGGIMPNSQYVSNLMIATGYINKAYATKYISVIAHFLMEDELWSKEIEQINITRDKQVELIPRNSEHVVNIGKMPQINDADPPSKKYVAINDYLKRQLTRLELFYRYVPQTLEPPIPNDTTNALNSQSYDYIDLEYNNQIICQRRTSL